MAWIVGIFFVILGLAVDAGKVVFQSPTAIMMLCFTVAALVGAVEYSQHQVRSLKEHINKYLGDDYSSFNNDDTPGFHKMED